MRCVDCPDMPNGTRKRPTCCRREGAVLVSDRIPIEPPARKARPTPTGRVVLHFGGRATGKTLQRALLDAKPVVERAIRRAIIQAMKR